MTEYPIYRKGKPVENQTPGNNWAGVAIALILCATLVSIVYIIWG